jgi:nucleotide-binding universal stress UspA family protein
MLLSTLSRPAATGSAPPAVFRSVLCGAGGGELALEAARQAAVLAADGTLELVAIEPAGGGDAPADLDAALRIAARHGIEPAVRRVPGRRAMPALLLLAARHDLLVVGAHEAGAPRPDSARAAVHQSPVPVLVARRPSGGRAVTERIVVAVDGSPEASEAMTVARALGRRHGSALSDLRLGPDEPDVPAAIVRGAVTLDATLVVTGSRGLSGIAALGSVSERVAAEAHCSVLILRR